jgi:hypothetical protein
LKLIAAEKAYIPYFGNSAYVASGIAAMQCLGRVVSFQRFRRTSLPNKQLLPRFSRIRRENCKSVQEQRGNSNAAK